jgi:glycosyltransferase involved in cell wall biosynthesis
MPRVLVHCPDARLVLVGDGEDRVPLVELTRALGLEGSVSFVGERPHEDVIRFMRAADLFVLPSLVESFGIVLVEAMSCGLPVVASNIMGIPSVVTDRINGSLVPPGDEIALGEGITRLLMDPSERAAIEARNQQQAAGYAWPNIADRFLQLWQGAAASGHLGVARASHE